jgi:aspartate ammonia-lyase
MVGFRRLVAKRVDGIVANVERCRQVAESSESIGTPLNRLVRYEAAAKIAGYAEVAIVGGGRAGCTPSGGAS